jgi:hypothetical protein
MKANVARSLGPGPESALQNRRAACDGAEKMFSQTAMGLPTFEAYGGFEIAFHVKLSPDELGCRRIDIGGKQMLEGFAGGNAKGKTGNPIPGPPLGSISEKDAPNRLGGTRRIYRSIRLT